MKTNKSKVLTMSLFMFLMIFFPSVINHIKYPSNQTWEDFTKFEDKTPQFSSWMPNGTVISAETQGQYLSQLCSDGSGGAIITWSDERNDPQGWDRDIYAQKFNSNQEVEWTTNGVGICIEDNDQCSPQICSDGSGGAIITWYDARDEIYDIYAQRINSAGNVQWTSNGIPICTGNDYQGDIQICSDGAGGAIITWSDLRSGSNYDIYAQRINSGGTVQWTLNGKAICTASNDQKEDQICSDGAGGAIITWYDYRSGSNYDIYAQRIYSNGNTLWTANGVAICTASNNQLFPQVCSYGTGGAIITWHDYRSGSNYDIYAQKINSNGNTQWTSNGVAITTSTNNERDPQICSDGAGGAFITFDGNGIRAQRINSIGNVLWTYMGIRLCFSGHDPQICIDGAGGAIIAWNDDYRGESVKNIYMQGIDPNGNILGPTDGIAVSTAINDQDYCQICSDGAGVAFITWTDWRNGDADIYAYRRQTLPNAYHSGSVTTAIGHSETINWVLCDDRGGGQYRVIANNTLGNNYVWVDWTPWTVNNPLHVPINRTALGIYSYTIEYYDNQVQYGIPNTVIVTILADNIPTSNHPEPIITGATGSETINWTLFDDYGEGQYRVIANNTLGNYYVWVDWTQWYNNTPFNVPINRTTPGVYNYTIEFYDDHNNYGIPNTVIVTISDENPTSNHPGPIITSNIGTETIDWILYDDFGGGQYRVIANNTLGNYYVWVDWTPWYNNTALNVPINRTAPGLYNYTIKFYDDHNNFGISDTVIVTIIEGIPTSNHPGPVSTSATGAETIDWILYDDFGEGEYHVIVNNTLGNYYVWVDWTPWYNNTALNVPINRTAPGVYNYTIEFYDYRYNFGISDTVIVTIIDGIPTSNHPGPVSTSATGAETIDWILYDDYGEGEYRVITNNTLGNYYVWVDWTPWYNNTALNVPINRTAPGIFNFTIEFYDYRYYFGISDTLIVTIIDGIPTSNHPGPVSTSATGAETIDWILYDDFGGGQYRVITNNTLGNYYVWVDWTPWYNNTALNIPINRTAPGIFNFTIEFYDYCYNFGIHDNVLVTIIDNIPSSTHPVDIITSIDGDETITWTLNDDFGGGQYRVVANNTEGNSYTWVEWTSWTLGTPVIISINRTVAGVYSYTIEYYDDHNQFGISDMVIVTIEAVKDGEEIPVTIIIIAIASAAGGIGATIITLGILRKRKLTREIT